MSLQDDPLVGLADLLERPLGTVVHVGAGSGRALARYAAIHPHRLVLIEGDPATAAELAQRAGTATWITVHALPVAPCSGPLHWNRYNLNALNGPWDAASLRDRYPGLRLVASTSLHATSLQSLLDALAVAGEAANVLVLDTPGQQVALLESLGPQALDAFDVLILRSPSASDGAPPIEADLLRLRGYRLHSTVGARTMWPIHRYVCDAAARSAAAWELRAASTQADLNAANALASDLQSRILALEQPLTVARETAGIQATRAAAAVSERDQIAAQRDAVIVERDLATLQGSALAAQLRDALSQRDEIASERDQLQARLDAAVADLGDLRQMHAVLREAHTVQTQREQVLRQEHAEAEIDRDRHAGEAAALRSELFELQRKHGEDLAAAREQAQRQTVAEVEEVRAEEEEKARAAVTSLRQEASAAAEAAAEQTRRLDDELKVARRTAHLAVQMQTLREADLKDLQGRYRTTLERLENQQELLTKLGQRLTTANNYFLQLANPERLPALTANARRAPSRAGPKTGTSLSGGRLRSDTPDADEGSS